MFSFSNSKSEEEAWYTSTSEKWSERKAKEGGHDQELSEELHVISAYM